MTTPGTPADLVAGVRAICLAFPEAYEEAAWTGVRWRIRSRTFGHLLTIADGWPEAYARAAGVEGPAHVLMFRAADDELDALRHSGSPFFPTPWRADEIGLFLDDGAGWAEVTELLTDSYCLQAPQRLARLVHRPSGQPDEG